MKFEPEIFKPLKDSGKFGGKKAHVSDQLRNHIHARRLAVGSVLPTARALAKQMQVSYVTVHAALDDLAREGWLVRRQGRGTFVGKGPSRKRPEGNPSIVLALPFECNLESALLNTGAVAHFLRGCALGAVKCNVSFSMISVMDGADASEFRKTVEQILRHDGAILVRGGTFDLLVKELEARGFPYVTLAAGGEGLSNDVNYNRQLGVRMGVGHLLSHGCGRIGFLGNIAGAGSEKFAYFCQAVVELGGTLSSEHFENYKSQPHSLRLLLEYLKRRALPDALFVDDFELGESLLQAMEFLGLSAPNDIAVLAYGSEPVERRQSTLSFVEVPLLEIAKEGVILLCRMIRNQGEADQAEIGLLKPRLRLRGSCGCGETEGTPVASVTTGLPAAEKPAVNAT